MKRKLNFVLSFDEWIEHYPQSKQNFLEKVWESELVLNAQGTHKVFDSRDGKDYDWWAEYFPLHLIPAEYFKEPYVLQIENIGNHSGPRSIYGSQATIFIEAPETEEAYQIRLQELYQKWQKDAKEANITSTFIRKVWETKEESLARLAKFVEQEKKTIEEFFA